MLSMLSKSRFYRRLHRVKPFILNLFETLSTVFKAINDEALAAAHTKPIK
jgi:hypothetical protein